MFIGLATEVSRESQMSSHHGAVVYKGKRIYATGVNTNNRTYSRKLGVIPGYHAETAALREAFPKVFANLNLRHVINNLVKMHSHSGCKKAKGKSKVEL
jgi:tRNA(Arg) A34 adenosine deaminase TadA